MEGSGIYAVCVVLLCFLQCAGVINLGGEVGCMLSEGPWVFVGLPNVVKVRWEVHPVDNSCLHILCFYFSCTC